MPRRAPAATTAGRAAPAQGAEAAPPAPPGGSRSRHRRQRSRRAAPLAPVAAPPTAARPGTGGSGTGGSVGSTGGSERHGREAPARAARLAPVAALASSGTGGAAGAGATTFFTDDFESDMMGKQPAGFDNLIAYNFNATNPQGDISTPTSSGSSAVADNTHTHNGSKMAVHFHEASNPAFLELKLASGINHLYSRVPGLLVVAAGERAVERQPRDPARYHRRSGQREQPGPLWDDQGRNRNQSVPRPTISLRSRRSGTYRR